MIDPLEMIGVGAGCFLVGLLSGAALEERNGQLIINQLQAVIRTLENQLKDLAEHASRLESPNPKDKVPLPPSPLDRQPFEVPAQPGGAQQKKPGENRY